MFSNIPMKISVAVRMVAVVMMMWLRPEVYGAESTYYILGQEQGLRGRQVLQMMQLGDGRMVVVTESHVNLYDGSCFRSIPVDSSAVEPLAGYDGDTHLYVDASERLWMKGRHKIACLDLKTLRLVSGCKALAADIDISDLYIDSGGGIWTVASGCVRGQNTTRIMRLPAGCGVVQDIDVSGSNVYVFTSRGLVCVFGGDDGGLIHVSAAYDDVSAERYSATSLVVKTSDGLFHQIRTGGGRSVFLTFNPVLKSWKKHFECDYTLHTLICGGGTAYITMPEGYMTYDFKTGSVSRHDSLRLPDGTMLSTGINTVCRDREGGTWFGTYGNGLLYLSPLSGIFDSGESDVLFTPLMLSVTVSGKRIYSGDKYTEVDAPYIDRLCLDYSDNNVAFCLSPVKYVRPRRVFYRYRLSGIDSDWHVADADSDNSPIDSRGQLVLSYIGLSPGDYRLEVMVSPRDGVWNGGVYRLSFTVGVPWWRSAWAMSVYAVIVAMAVWLYVRGVKRREALRAREEMLLMRIRNLMEQCRRNESPVSVILSDKEDKSGMPEMDKAETEFLQRATEFVERHIDDSGYTVEQLSRDLYMERTGLYRKLTAILDKSPQMFIRSIRLRKAAEMLSGGGMTVSEVADATGFSSPSYFTKCFQKEYGCRPTEYKGGAKA